MRDIIERSYRLLEAYRAGELGGSVMPEDANPGLDLASKENYMYFTLPMALNYQRNSYVLWQCADKMYREHPEVFDASCVIRMPQDELRHILTSYKVALQPNKQPMVWNTLCETIEKELGGDIRDLFRRNGESIQRIKDDITSKKKHFPYLGGKKICNYWLHVMEKYTDAKYVDRENLTIAPDTHVIQASLRLGMITEAEASDPAVQSITAQRWEELLKETDILPIDMHTPLWLWSRGRFMINI